MRESWLVEDRWWTDRPLRRRYWEVVTVDGRDLVVFRDLEDGGGTAIAETGAVSMSRARWSPLSRDAG